MANAVRLASDKGQEVARGGNSLPPQRTQGARFEMKPVRAVGAHLQGLGSMFKISTLNVVRSHWNGFHAED